MMKLQSLTAIVLDSPSPTPALDQATSEIIQMHEELERVDANQFGQRLFTNTGQLDTS